MGDILSVLLVLDLIEDVKEVCTSYHS